jgi:hypothetical protein
MIQPSLFWHHMSLVLLVLCTGFSSSTAAAISGRCQPQGLLKLDKPYPEPRRVKLPFCQQVRLCSNCNCNWPSNWTWPPILEGILDTFAVQLALSSCRNVSAALSLTRLIVCCVWAVLQYGCSCCNASHAMALQRSSRVIAEDEDLSTDCKLGLLRLACRVCDPEVGADGLAGWMAWLAGWLG